MDVLDGSVEGWQEELGAGVRGLRITEILEGIPGAWGRARRSIAQARRGETVGVGEIDQEPDHPMHELKELIRANRPDEAWADELRELREDMDPMTDPWRD